MRVGSGTKLGWRGSSSALLCTVNADPDTQNRTLSGDGSSHEHMAGTFQAWARFPAWRSYCVARAPMTFLCVPGSRPWDGD